MSNLLKYIFKYMSEEDKINLDSYVAEITNRSYSDFTEVELMSLN